MKAKVKATGHIVDVVKSSFTTEIYDINGVKRTLNCTIYRGAEKNYREDELEFDVDYNPDYWTRLEHQAAIAAMQGVLSNPEYLRSLMHTKHDDYRAHEVVPDVAMRLAHALVEKYKKEEK